MCQNYLQFSLPHVQHRYVVGVSDDAMYVSFMGTKAMRDIISDVNYVQTAIWPGLLGDVSEVPTAHQGFLARSESVLVELLYAHASKQNKRLVLCGHSLGGAVAQLCALRLLHDLPPYLVEQGRVKCISFAAPPVGNSALANTVSYKGWSGLFYNLALPEDVVPRLLAMQNSVSLPAAAAEAMLTQSSGSRAASSHQGPPEEEDPAGSHGRSKPEEEMPQSEMAPKSMHVPGDENGSEAPAETQPAVPARDGHARPMGRAATFASTAARYLPIYMHIGSQHHLHAPPGEPPLRPSSRQNSAEDAETLAALEEQDGRAAVGREWLFAMREAARPAELCDDIAPVLDVAGASSRVPPSRPQFPAPGSSGGQQSSRWPNLQWASTLGALTSFIQPTRQTVPADIDAAVETEPGPPPQQPRSRQWLSWAGGSGRSEDFPPTPSAQMPLRISVRGRGLASCTKARVLAAGGVWCPARIVSSPPIPSLHAGAHAGSPPYQDQAADVAQSAHWPHGTSLGEASPFSTALAGSVRLVSLWPDTPRAAAFSVMAGLVARHLRASTERQEGPLRPDVHVQASKEVSTSKQHDPDGWQQGPSLDEQRKRGRGREQAA
ncbi:hypothetical protein WJX75_002253 [Coccomyxa subellipsoidea]|uniref:Fungal lipase-type domain-containing protein n=1 Tax=Coccomyxa subellipsoidea TaxID=248742 RepID=A0ABR2YQY3_9CHLO